MDLETLLYDVNDGVAQITLPKHKGVSLVKLAIATRRRSKQR